MRSTGTYREVSTSGETVHAFVPHPLPPTEPRLELTPERQDRVRRAEHALARLDLASEMVPSLDWFLYAFVRKEAVVSSQIEGTQATLVDLLAFEAEKDITPSADVEEICNYIDALKYARTELAKANGLPLSIRLMNEAHRRLMNGTRGHGKLPGDVRCSQNWIGGSRPGTASFVPPPPDQLPQLLSDLERYIHAEDDLPAIVRAGLIHVQFETIHPYLDGNGRIGRLLIALLLQEWGLLKAPLLYLSMHFKRTRSEYYRRLGAVRTEGDWEGWTDYFLEGVTTVADEAIILARDVFALVSEDRARVLAASGSTVSAVRLFEKLPQHPVLTVAGAIDLLDTSKPTAAKAIDLLERAGVLKETTGRHRDRSFVYHAYVGQLKIGTELIAS